MQLKVFTFNAFQENTYVLWDDSSRSAIIIDPGCSTSREENELLTFISSNNLIPARLLNTHCHIDHVLGNKFIANQYDLKLECHKKEVPVLESCINVSRMYGIPYKGSPSIEIFHEDDDEIEFAGKFFKVLFTPGHSPGSISFYSAEDDFLIGGDVLFLGSIGRTDLPGGDYDTLIHSVKSQLLPLPDQTIVYPGHGPATTIGRERSSNPFLI